MSYRIDPDRYCSADGCTRPRSEGEELCTQCSRLARAVGRPVETAAESDSAGGVRELSPEVLEFLADEPKLPRCVAYLSRAGDVITLELTGEPKFTEADVEAIAALLSNMRKAA
jgi:hypothetical protein